MCGEHVVQFDAAPDLTGSSPHVRGAQKLFALAPRLRRIIPACAGSTFCHGAVEIGERDHPRMCGEHTKKILLQPITLGRLAHY